MVAGPEQQIDMYLCEPWDLGVAASPGPTLGGLACGGVAGGRLVASRPCCMGPARPQLSLHRARAASGSGFTVQGSGLPVDLPVPAEPLQARLQGLQQAFCQPGRRSDQLHMLASEASPDQTLHRSGTCILVWVMVLVDPSTPNKCWQRCSQHKPVVAECCGRAQVLIPIPLCASARSMPKVCADCQAQWSTGTNPLLDPTPCTPGLEAHVNAPAI